MILDWLVYYPFQTNRCRFSSFFYFLPQSFFLFMRSLQLCTANSVTIDIGGCRHRHRRHHHHHHLHRRSRLNFLRVQKIFIIPYFLFEFRCDLSSLGIWHTTRTMKCLNLLVGLIFSYSQTKHIIHCNTHTHTCTYIFIWGIVSVYHLALIKYGRVLLPSLKGPHSLFSIPLFKWMNERKEIFDSPIDFFLRAFYKTKLMLHHPS